jgi:hypothetical protein
MLLEINHFASTIEKGTTTLCSYVAPETILALDQDISLGKSNYWVVATTRKNYIIDKNEHKRLVKIIGVLEEEKEEVCSKNGLI